MISEEIGRVCLKSAEDMLSYSELFGASESVVRVRRCKVSGNGNLILVLDSAVMETTGMYLRIGGDVFCGDCIEFIFNDPRSKTLGVRFVKGDVGSILAGDPEIELIADLSFLVAQTRDYYQSFGGMIGYPSSRPVFVPEEYPFPEGKVPTDEQRSAVRTILNSQLSYVWGAPGTGKTQMVLATAIMAYVRKRRKVAVIAPTNNAVEQVLRGLVAAIKEDDGYSSVVDLDCDIARIGSPTPSFLRDFPCMCEPKAVRNASRSIERERKILESVLDDRAAERAKPFIVDCLSLMEKGDEEGARASALSALGFLEHRQCFEEMTAALRRMDFGRV